MTSGEPFVVAGQSVAPGERRRIEIPVAQTYGPVSVSLPTVVVHGGQPGPRLFVSAAIHGDEINGVEIIRRLLGMSVLSRLRGTLLAVPVVNVYGFVHQSRYLPDRRDLNRSFPGSPRGSLTARLAHVFVKEVVERCSHGIDLHTAAQHRSNLPYLRACVEHPETLRLAESFGVPVILNANLSDGSLRQSVLERDIPMLVYEAGEALRFDEVAIRAGVRGVLSVMRGLGMLKASRKNASRVKPLVTHSSRWLRASRSGLLRTRIALGARVRRDQLMGVISDPLGEEGIELRSSLSGIVIGRTELPLVNEGDALFHVAAFDETDEVGQSIDSFQAELDPEEMPAPSAEPPIV